MIRSKHVYDNVKAWFQLIWLENSFQGQTWRMFVVEGHNRLNNLTAETKANGGRK